MKIISVDAETDGLYGQVFAIGAVALNRLSGSITEYSARLDDLSVVKDAWVRANVIPHVEHIRRVFKTHEDLFDDFWSWLVDQGTEKMLIGHMVHPVETGLFRELIEGTERRSPYPAIHDVATLLWLYEEPDDSVDAYIAKHGLAIPAGKPHDPLYDAHAALVAWNHLTQEREDKIKARCAAVAREKQRQYKASPWYGKAGSAGDMK